MCTLKTSLKQSAAKEAKLLGIPTKYNYLEPSASEDSLPEINAMKGKQPDA